MKNWFSLRHNCKSCLSQSGEQWLEIIRIYDRQLPPLCSRHICAETQGKGLYNYSNGVISLNGAHLSKDFYNWKFVDMLLLDLLVCKVCGLSFVKDAFNTYILNTCIVLSICRTYMWTLTTNVLLFSSFPTFTCLF